MSPLTHNALRAAAVLALLSALAGCAYDYRQRTDRVGYSAGDAVKANLARETTNPTKVANSVDQRCGQMKPARSPTVQS